MQNNSFEDVVFGPRPFVFSAEFGICVESEGSCPKIEVDVREFVEKMGI